MGKIILSTNSSNPSAPAASNWTMFPKADGWYQMDSAGNVTKFATAGSGAPATAQFVVSGSSPDLPNARVLTAGPNVTIDNSVPGISTISSTGGGGSSGISSYVGVAPINVSGSAISHDLTGFNYGTYDRVFVDLKGHVTSGSPMRIDQFYPAIDITDLNASGSAHGLLPKLSGVSTQYLNGVGGWSTPASGSGGGSSGSSITYAGVAPISVSGSQISHDNSSITPGTYLRTTFDSKGHATGGSAGLVIGDIPAHASTHASGGSDALTLDELASPTDITTLNASGSAHGLMPKLSGVGTQFFSGSGGWGTPLGQTYSGSAGIVVSGSSIIHNVSGVSAGTYLRTTVNAQGHVTSGSAGLVIGDIPAHASTHKTGGSDAIKLDELSAPTDVTTLNASGSAHGLLPKLSGINTQYMDGSGNWSVPPSSGSSGGISGSGINNQLTIWNGSNSIFGSPALKLINDANYLGLDILSNDDSGKGSLLRQIAYSNSRSPYYFTYRIRGTVAFPNNILNGNSLWEIQNHGSYSGSTTYLGTWIKSVATQDWTSAMIKGARLDFMASPNDNGTNVSFSFDGTKIYPIDDNLINIGTSGSAGPKFKDIYSYSHVFKTSGSQATPKAGEIAVYGQTSDNKLYTKDSSGSIVRLSNNITENLLLSGAGMWASGGSGASLSSAWQTPTNKQTFITMDFSGSVTQYCEGTLVMPSTYDPTRPLDCIFHWTCTTSGSTSGSVAWNIQALGYANNDSLDGAWGTSGSAPSASGSAAYIGMESSSVSITPGGTPAANKKLHFRVFRDKGNAVDTLTSTARLIGVMISYGVT